MSPKSTYRWDTVREATSVIDRGADGQLTSGDRHNRPRTAVRGIYNGVKRNPPKRVSGKLLTARLGPFARRTCQRVRHFNPKISRAFSQKLAMSKGCTNSSNDHQSRFGVSSPSLNMSASLNFWIFPDAVSGKVSTLIQSLGVLFGARCSRI